MSSAISLSICLAILSWSLVAPKMALAQTSSVSRSPQSEEESVRNLTEKYGQAIASGDVEAIRAFWNPQSANLISTLRSYRNLFKETRIELIAPKVTRLGISSDKALSQLTSDQRLVDSKTGANLTAYDVFFAAGRQFEWVKTGGYW